MQKSSSTVRQIVITGGPASGKTTALEHLRVHHPELELVEEAATQVLNQGFPLPTEDNPWTQQWQNELQIAIASHQVKLEEMAVSRALNDGRSAVVQDRGLVDGAAYLAGGLTEFEALTGHSPVEALGRYHTVIYLGWLGNSNYETESNPVRFEDEQRARVVAGTILESWSEHPNLIEVNTQSNRAQEVADIVQQAVMLG